MEGADDEEGAAAPLPSGWKSSVSRKTSRIFYYNKATKAKTYDYLQIPGILAGGQLATMQDSFNMGATPAGGDRVGGKGWCAYPSPRLTDMPQYSSDVICTACG
jgi:hypothetical protein